MISPELKQAVILAGGRGVRLGSLTDETPKPLIPIRNQPFLGYLLEQLKEQGIQEVLVLVGYLADQIREYCGDGSTWGLSVKCLESPLEAETGPRLADAAGELASHFLLMYCDNYWPMHLGDVWQRYAQAGALAQVTVYANQDGYTRNNVRVDSDGFITAYDPERGGVDLNGVEIGYAILAREVLDYLPRENVTFSHSVYPRLADLGLLKAYETSHRYYSIGSPERLQLTAEFLEPQRAVILDRDGTLNRRPPQAQYVKSWEEFQWLPGAVEALKLLKDAGYKLILASNQSGIARGVMSEADLIQIHRAMEEDLARHNVVLDALYYCPHGWDDGCQCRKPRPGMLFQAQRDFHLDLTKTMFIGDDPRDNQAGEAAGCLVDLVSLERPLLQAAREYLTSHTCMIRNSW